MDTQNKIQLIADRYADALINLVQSGNISYEKVSQDLDIISQTLVQSPDLREVLDNPIISTEDKKDVIDSIFGSEIDRLVINFLKIVVEKKRFFTFKEIQSEYKKRLDQINNISRIKVTSAVDLNDEMKNKIIDKLQTKLQKTVEVDWDKDEEIIAGLIIKMGDNIIDTSLKNKLEDLSKNIVRDSHYRK